MYAGKVMESAPLVDFLARPAHPYTVGLKGSVIEVGTKAHQLRAIPGMATALTEPPRACPFAERCQLAADRCLEELPPLRPLGLGHYVACHRAEEVLAAPGTTVGGQVGARVGGQVGGQVAQGVRARA
jgi:peptide/nickel transport system ATP-binding protein/oligopeptide transport system ATP-binding protein